MDIRIGIINSSREISFESAQAASEIEKVVSDALESSAKFFKLTDEKGSVYLVPREAGGDCECCL